MRMRYPTGGDYLEAVQHPDCCFEHLLLRQATAEVDEFNLPRPVSGRSAMVFRLDLGNIVSAVKCFTRDSSKRQDRYMAISEHLRAQALPYKVGFDYIVKGIRVNGEWFPVVRMDWVQGQPLTEYARDTRRDPEGLRRAADKWRKLAEDLRRAAIAHGDLQHGNVLVVGDRFKLVDYDGMYVPRISALPSDEIGQGNYQHPERNGHHYGPEMDRFSVLVIYLSLLALAADQSDDLWRFHGEDALLFHKQDFVAPAESALFQLLRQSRAPRISALSNALFDACLAPFDETPLLEEILPSSTPKAPTKQDASGIPEWLRPHVGQTQQPASPTPTPKPARSGDSGSLESASDYEIIWNDLKVAEQNDRVIFGQVLREGRHGLKIAIGSSDRATPAQISTLEAIECWLPLEGLDPELRPIVVRLIGRILRFRVSSFDRSLGKVMVTQSGLPKGKTLKGLSALLSATAPPRPTPASTQPASPKPGRPGFIVKPASATKAPYVVKGSGGPSWAQVVAAHKDEAIIDGKVIGTVKGGLLVNLGRRGFLPGSQVDRPNKEGLSVFLGRTLPLMVTKVNDVNQSVVVSHRAAVNATRTEARQRVLSDLKEGDVRTGTVRGIKDFGAFVDLGGLDGLVHTSEMSWKRLVNPREVVKQGDTVRVKVLSIDRTQERVSLSMRQLQQDPWDTAVERYPPGTVVRGRVVRLMENGAVVCLDDGLEGFLRNADFPQRDSIQLSMNQEIEGSIKEIRPEERRLLLAGQGPSNPSGGFTIGDYLDYHGPAVPARGATPREEAPNGVRL